MASTIYDIAERADVSTATVSRVFNDEAEVAEDTRSRVLRAAEELNYQPHGPARSLARQRTHLIGVVVPVLANPFYMGVLRGVQEALDESDYDLLVYAPSHPGDIEQQLQRASQRGRSDGLLFLSAPITEGIEETLTASSQEVVLVDTEHPGFESISIDNEKGGYKATRYLMELGYERIAHITSGEPEPPPATQRRKGYERALREDEVPHTLLVARGDEEPFAFDKGGGYDAMTELLTVDPLPDAVFAASDMQALGALEAIAEAGLSVPDDIALMGFDDIDASAHVSLTTLRQPLRDFGKRGTEKLIRRLKDPGRSVSKTVFAPELVVRESCGHAVNATARE